MAKAKLANGSSSRKPADPQRAATMRAVWIHASAALLVLIAAGAGFVLLHRHVEKRIAFPSRPPKVVLKNRPAWMSDLVAEQIAQQVAPRGAHSSFDHAML